MPEPIARNIIQNDLRTGQKSTYTPPVQGPRTTLEELNPRRFQEGPRYFGFHSDASLLARIAQMGLAPNALNLKIVQQMLRYGLPLSAANMETVKGIWKQQGGSPLALESLVLLQSQGIPVSDKNLAAIGQLLSGGPMAHNLARLTMTMKNGPSINKELERILSGYWKLGSGDLQAESRLFQQLYGDIRRFTKSMDLNKLPTEIAGHLQQIERLMDAQQLLAPNSFYLPFYQWKDQQPLPGEMLVDKDGSQAAQEAGFVQLSLALETKNLGRINCGITLIRGQLSMHLDVTDQAIQQMVQTKIDLLRARLNVKTTYTVASLQCNNIGQTRAISILVPKRRDVRRLGRVIGVM